MKKKIIGGKKGVSFDEERIQMGIHNFSQHKKQNWLLTTAQNVYT
jgi:hypothetical protein